MSKKPIYTRIQNAIWHRFLNGFVSGIALTEGDLKKGNKGFYLQTESKQIPVTIKEDPTEDGHYLITITPKSSKGWHEPPGASGKAPEHQKVALKGKAKHAQNKPMKKKETILDKWNNHTDSLDRNHKGFEVFDYNSGEASIEELAKIIKGGQEALDNYIMELQEMNLEYTDSMFKQSFDEFLKDEETDKNTIENEEEFRMSFEGHINYNVGKLFDYHVLLLERKQYEVSYDGASSEIDESDTEGKEFKKKALQYITEKQFKTILINSYGGVGYFGIIIHASEIIEAIQKGEKIVSDNQLVVGIHDWMNGAGYFERATVKPNYEIALNNAMLDTDRYGIGGVFGTSEWNWK